MKEKLIKFEKVKLVAKNIQHMFKIKQPKKYEKYTLVLRTMSNIKIELH